MKRTTSIEKAIKKIEENVAKGRTFDLHLLADKFEAKYDQVLDACRQLQEQGRGKLVVGRHGMRTRFVSDKQQGEEPVSITGIISAPKLASEEIMSYIERVRAKSQKSNVSVTVDQLAKKYKRGEVVAAFKQFTEAGIGNFVVGRKGWKSRFETITQQGQTAPVPVPEKPQEVTNQDLAANLGAVREKLAEVLNLLNGNK